MCSLQFKMFPCLKIGETLRALFRVEIMLLGLQRVILADRDGVCFDKDKEKCFSIPLFHVDLENLA